MNQNYPDWNNANLLYPHHIDKYEFDEKEFRQVIDNYDDRMQQIMHSRNNPVQSIKDIESWFTGIDLNTIDSIEKIEKRLLRASNDQVKQLIFIMFGCKERILFNVDDKCFLGWMGEAFKPFDGQDGLKELTNFSSDGMCVALMFIMCQNNCFKLK